MNLSLKKRLTKFEKHPTKAVIGAQISYEEQIFGRVLTDMSYNDFLLLSGRIG